MEIDNDRVSSASLESFAGKGLTVKVFCRKPVCVQFINKNLKCCFCIFLDSHENQRPCATGE